MSPGPFLFDSYALLAFFQKEKGHQKVARLLGEIAKEGRIKYLNVINLGEIIYITKREFGDQKKMEVLINIERLHFSILPVRNTLVFEAAEYKARFPISYADCFALASAIEHKATIVTGDPEFKKVEKLVDIFWI
jgi:ribonuclease VapC